MTRTRKITAQKIQCKQKSVDVLATGVRKQSVEQMAEGKDLEVAVAESHRQTNSAASTRSISIGLSKVNGGFVNDEPQVYENVEQKDGSIYMLPNTPDHNEQYEELKETLSNDDQLERFQNVELTMKSSDAGADRSLAGSNKMELSEKDGSIGRGDDPHSKKFMDVTANFSCKGSFEQEKTLPAREDNNKDGKWNGCVFSIADEKGKQNAVTNGVRKYQVNGPGHQLFPFPWQCLAYVAAACLLSAGLGYVLVVLFVL